MGGGYAAGWGLAMRRACYDNHRRIMATEIATLIDKPLLLAFVLAAGAVIGVGVDETEQAVS